jgi:hypothetical protein
MAVSIEQVPMWLPLRGNIGHAVELSKMGWYLTACGTFTPNGPPTPRRPKRICRKCRKRLREATLLQRP